jgi:uncharacterized protein YsxB (DUF464 family)
MILYNNKDKCTIYNKYFVDDMHPYEFDEPTCSLNYIDNGSSFGSSNVDMSKTLNKINELSISYKQKDIWYPAFINKANSLINTKILFRGAPSLSDDIGIEDAIFFGPKLKSWNINGQYRMSTDWILTAPLTPFTAEYGILFWYKESTIQGIQGSKIEDIPENSIVYPIGDYSYIDYSQKPSRSINVGPNTKLVKKNNNTLYILNDENDVIVTDTFIYPGTTSKVFSINKYMEYKKLKENNTLYRLAGSTLVDNRPNLSIYISDGEMYSYTLSKETMESSYRDGIASQSYLSPILYPIYRELYNILTLRYTRNIEKIIVEDKIQTNHKPFFDVKQNRLFKKLVYALSTFPLIDRTTVAVLNSKNIFDIIDKYINTKINNLQEETNLLQQTLILISSEFRDLSEDYKNESSIVVNSGPINDKHGLFKRLVSKYGSQLRLNGDVKLTYREGLPNGPHVKINQDIVSKCNITLKNDIVYNNVVFDLDPFKCESVISKEASSFVLYNKNLPNNKVIIPLWDITKKSLMLKDLEITAGPDIQIDFPTIANRDEDNETNTSPEIQQVLDKAVVLLGDRGNPTIITGEEPEILWTRLSGPDCLRFSNDALSISRSNTGSAISVDTSSRYAVSSDINPTLYIKRPGKYVLQLKVKTSFGVIYDTVTVHVTEPGVYSRSEPLQGATIQNLRPTNGLTVILPNIRECAIGKQGVFWPIYSDCNVELPQINSIPVIQPFGGPLNKFAIPMQANKKGEKIIREGITPLSITYKCGNTTIDLSRIILTNMLDANENCNQCQGFYEGILDNDGFYLDNNNSVLLMDPLTRDLIDVPTPTELSTDKSIIKAYGGYDKDIINNIGINIPGHPPPSAVLGSIYTTGEILNEPKKDGKVTYICHDTTLNIDRSHEFTKGCFHPFSGWLDTTIHRNFENKTASLKFAPNYRPTQTFKGLGFDKLYNSFVDGKSVTYKSMIELRVNEIAYDFIAPFGAKPEEIQRLQKEHDKQELEDHDKNYGYRSITNDFGTNLALNDEYLPYYSEESEMPVSSTEYCESDTGDEFLYSAAYEMMKPGTFIPKKDRDPEDPHYRFNREGASAIQGIEVKLNFLNYINPKDLVVWLEIETCGQVADALDPPLSEGSRVKKKPRDRWYTGSYNTTVADLKNLPYDPDTSGVKTYLYRLLKMNDNDTIVLDQTPPPVSDIPFNDPEPAGIDNIYKIYLLNQDHIYSINNNDTLHFQDNQDLYRHSSNLNMSYSIFDNQNVSTAINNTIKLPPTISAPGFSDYDSQYIKKAIVNNNLLNNGHKFEKVKSMSLFGQSPAIENKPGNSDATRFTLCIAVLNETEDGLPYDRIVSTDYMLDANGIISKNRCNIPNNSLCSWELILHKNADTLGFTPGDALGDIDYVNTNPYASGVNNLNIPGHNFIADFKDKEYLLPPAVLNAPNQYFLDGVLCRYAKAYLNIPNYSVTPLNILPIAFMFPVTLVGALVSTISLESQLSQQTRNIIDWFNNERRQRQNESFNRENVVPSYTRYSYGGPNKALLSISKDKKIWYKTEASIYKYDNSIVMKHTNYTYYRLHIDSPLKALSIFSVNILGLNNEQVLDKKQLLDFVTDPEKTIYFQLKDGDAVPQLENIEREINDIKRQIEDINKRKNRNQSMSLADLTKKLEMYEKTLNGIGTEILENDLIDVEFETENRKLYVAKYAENNKNQLILSTVSSFDQLLLNPKYMSKNNIIDLFQNLQPISTYKNIIVTVKGKRAYHFFNKDASIITIRPVEVNESTQIEINRLQAKIDQITTTNETFTPEIIDEIRVLEHQIWKLQHAFDTNKIKSKGVIQKQGEFYTMFLLDKPLSDDTKYFSIAKEESKRIVFFDTDNLTISSKDVWPINIWSNDKNVDFDTAAPLTSFTTFGEGNYGYGSNVVEPSILYNQEIRNRVTPIVDIVDLNKNSTVDLCEVSTVDKNNKRKQTRVSSGAFGYNLEDIDSSLNLYENMIVIKSNELNNLDIDIKSIISRIIRDSKYSVFHKNFYQYYCLEISLLDTDDLEDTGKVYFAKDIKPNIIYAFKNNFENASKELQTRLKQIITEIETIEKEKQKNIDSTVQKNESFYIRDSAYQSSIDNLYHESSTIKYYLDKCSTSESQTTKIPHITVEYTKDKNGVVFIEITNDSYYWINIDPEQGCSIDIDRSPKILVEVKYTCERYNDLITFSANQICVPNANSGGADSLSNGIDENFTIDGDGSVTYTVPESKIEVEKAKYRGVNWLPGYWTSERKFFLNGYGKERNQLIIAEYKYIVATDNSTKTKPDGIVENKITDIFNLDSTYNLFVEFKIIPRKLRNIDKKYDQYSPNQYGQLTKSILPSAGGPIDTKFKIWRCLDPKTGIYLDKTPLYYQWLNEMIFRCYFGSSDLAEFKGASTTQSKDEAAWIPYDYY